MPIPPTVPSSLLVTFVRHLEDSRRQATFSQSLGDIVEWLLEAFGGVGATVWVPDTPHSIAKGSAPHTQTLVMAYTTFSRQDINQFDSISQSDLLNQRLRTTKSRVGLCFASGAPVYYQHLDIEPPCSQPGVLKRYGLFATWVLPLHIENLASSQYDVAVPSTLRIVITIDGHSNMLRHLSEEIRHIIRLASIQIERAIYAEQHALNQEILRAIGSLETNRAAAMSALVEQFRIILDFQACTLASIEPTHQSLRISASTDPALSREPRQKVFPLAGRGPVSTAWSGKRTVVREAGSTEDEWSDGDGKDDTIADPSAPSQVIAEPIISSSEDTNVSLTEPLGVLRLRNKQPTIDRNQQPLHYPINAIDIIRVQRASAAIWSAVRLESEIDFRHEILRRIRHDQKTPARVIRDFAQYHSHGTRTPEWIRSHADQIQRGLQDVEAFAEVMLILSDLARLSTEEADKSVLKLDKSHRLLRDIVVPISKMMRPVARLYRLADDRPVYYDADSFTDPQTGRQFPEMFVDVGLIRVAFFNVIDNAVKYAHGNTQVTVSGEVDHDKKQFIVHVENYGIRINPDEVESIFRPYYRTPAAIAFRNAGVGIGLGFARTIMRLHEGDLVLSRSWPTRFSFIFPFSLTRIAE